MKLHYAPGACSLGIHVILEEIGKPYELAKLDLKSGEHTRPEFAAKNPKGKVPALELDDGEVLTEFPAIAVFLARTNPKARLLPDDPLQQARALEALDWVIGQAHADGFRRIARPERFAPEPASKETIQEMGRDNMAKAFKLLDETWRGGDYVLSTGYSIADAALFYVEYWYVTRVGRQLPPRLHAHYERMLARPAVQRMMQQEELAA